MNYDSVIEAVYSARKIALDLTATAKISEKSKNDFVTEVDFSISNYLKIKLHEIAPDVAFVTEEESKHINMGKRFILDPIDGTTNLTRRYNLSSISLAYVEENEPQFGVVFNPFTYELFLCVKGNGAHFYSTKYGISRLLKVGVKNFVNPITASDRNYTEAIVEFGAGVSNKEQSTEIFAFAQKTFNDCLDLRRMCSTALAICYIASGKLDGYFERSIKVWDYAAAALILKEAGGNISTWSGQNLPFTEPSTIVAGSRSTYHYLIERLGKEFS